MNLVTLFARTRLPSIMDQINDSKRNHEGQLLKAERRIIYVQQSKQKNREEENRKQSALKRQQKIGSKENCTVLITRKKNLNLLVW